MLVLEHDGLMHQLVQGETMMMIDKTFLQLFNKIKLNEGGMIKYLFIDGGTCKIFGSGSFSILQAIYENFAALPLRQ